MRHRLNARAPPRWVPLSPHTRAPSPPDGAPRAVCAPVGARTPSRRSAGSPVEGSGQPKRGARPPPAAAAQDPTNRAF